MCVWCGGGVRVVFPQLVEKAKAALPLEAEVEQRVGMNNIIADRTYGL